MEFGNPYNVDYIYNHKKENMWSALYQLKKNHAHTNTLLLYMSLIFEVVIPTLLDMLELDYPDP